MQNRDYWTPKNDGGCGGASPPCGAASRTRRTSSPPISLRAASNSDAAEPRAGVRAHARGEDLLGVRALLSLRARRPAGAADRHGCRLRRHCQRGPAASAAYCIESIEQKGASGLSQNGAVQVAWRRRPGVVLQLEPYCRAWWRAGRQRRSASCRPMWRQNGHQRGRERRLFVGFTNEVTVGRLGRV